MKWQPIENAPKDGTRVLAYGSYQWENYKERQETGIICAEYDKECKRWIAISTNPYFDCVQPTHWMPLPNPPTEDL